MADALARFTHSAARGAIASGVTAVRCLAAAKAARPAWYALPVCLVFAGCASPPQPSPLIDLRPRLGTVAFVAEPSGMPVMIGSPARGGADGALKGAGQGVLLGVAVGGGMASGGGYGAVAGILLGGATAIVAAPIGALFGAAQARSQSEVEAAERSLKKAMEEASPSGLLAAEFRAREKAMPVAADAPGKKISEPAPAPADTRLEVSVQRYGLGRRGIGVADPDFQLFVEARARLVRAADRAELYTHTWRYDGPSRSYFRWAENDGAPLRTELRQASQRLAAEIVHHMFEAPSPSRRALDVIDGARPPPRPGVDTVAPPRP